MAGTLTVDTIQSDSSYNSVVTIPSKVNFTGGMQIGGQDTTFGGMRNRVINGDMRIDQRNAGQQITTSVGANYAVDRFPLWTAVASKFTAKQNQGAVTPPPGFTNYLGATCSSAYTPSSTEYFLFQQAVEGYNVADLDYGKSTAKTSTVSFWVRSNLTGTFAFALRSGSLARQYVTSYTINQSNTWEYKTISIPGDTTGTWATDNTAGLLLCWDLGSHSTYEATTLNAWGNQGSNNQAYTFSGATKIISTLNNYLYITGVQFEKGSSATPFENRHFQHELSLCQRYYQKSYNASVVPGTVTSAGASFARGYNTDPYLIDLSPRFVCRMRTSPTVTVYSTNAGTRGKITGNGDVSVSSIVDGGETTLGFPLLTSAPSVGQDYRLQYTAEAEL